MNRPGNGTDEIIDKVFAGLRRVEAPSGMEDRILRTLEARRSEAGTASRRPGWRDFMRTWSSKPPAYIAGGLATAAMLIAVSLTHSNGLRKGSRKVASTSTLSGPALTARGPSRHSPTPLATRAVHVARSTSLSPSQPLSDEDALALSEMLAPSKPAPPLPLTRQEQMLAEVVHQGQPEELDSLRPEVRARQMELSKTEFRDFFEPPPAKHNE